MKITNTICRLLPARFRKKESLASQRDRFVTSVIRSHIFSKLTIQEKVLSLGRMIELFRVDNGYTPRRLQEALESLNRKQSNDLVKTWMRNYAKP